MLLLTCFVFVMNWAVKLAVQLTSKRLQLREELAAKHAQKENNGTIMNE
jgi:hypothetical protein